MLPTLLLSPEVFVYSNWLTLVSDLFLGPSCVYLLRFIFLNRNLMKICESNVIFPITSEF